MQMKSILAVYRAERFSPNSVEKDRSIIEAAGRLLHDMGHEVRFVKEAMLGDNDNADVILSMARESRTLDILEEKEKLGTLVINSPESVRACARATADKIMRENGIPVAPLEGNGGYWLKRGDEAAQSKDDVVFAADEDEKERKLQQMKERGVSDVVVTAHVKGDLVKFYGVRNTGFFRTYYPCDDGISKFGDERMNGPSHHYLFSEESLKTDADKAASLIGTAIYGGDCIVREDGSYAIIDFNDWPSFSRCREEAGVAISEMTADAIEEHGRTVPQATLMTLERKTEPKHADVYRLR